MGLLKNWWILAKSAIVTVMGSVGIVECYRPASADGNVLDDAKDPYAPRPNAHRIRAPVEDQPSLPLRLGQPLCVRIAN